MITLRTDRSTPQPSTTSSPISEEHASPAEASSFISDPHNPLMTTLMPQPGPSTAGVQLMPPGVCVCVSLVEFLCQSSSFLIIHKFVSGFR